MTEHVDRSKRRLLIAATTAAGGVAAVGAATPFVLSWMPSERAKAAGAPVEVDVSAIAPGAMLSVEWQGKPVWVVRRTQEMLDALGKHNDDLADPDSSVPQQPEYSKNPNRSINPEFLVVLGIWYLLDRREKVRLDTGLPRHSSLRLIFAAFAILTGPTPPQ